MSFYEQAWKSIIQPPQIRGKSSAYGPKEQIVDNNRVVRQDLTIINQNNKKIKGFIFSCPDRNAKDTILYVHGNGGTKLQALPLINLVIQYNVNLAAFDMLGCGHSDPGYLTYGIHQVHDMKDLVNEMKMIGSTQRIILWGRSMGAQCCIMYAQMYPDEVSAIVLDSPFRRLSDVVDRIANKQVNLPSCILSPALYFVKRKAQKQISLDIFDIDYLNEFKKISADIAILFIYSHFDRIVLTEQVLQFYNSYSGPKFLCQIYQTHDEDRPDKLFPECMAWIKRNKNNYKNIKIYKNTERSNYEPNTKSFC